MTSLKQLTIEQLDELLVEQAAVLAGYHTKFIAMGWGNDTEEDTRCRTDKLSLEYMAQSNYERALFKEWERRQRV